MVLNILIGSTAAAGASPVPATPPAGAFTLPSRPLVFNEPFDEQLGLWVQSNGGHTTKTHRLPKTHSGLIASTRLFIAAYLDALDPAQSTQILRALRKMQHQKPSSKFGCFSWYAEEPEPNDTNAAFFIGLNLIALDRTAADRLEPEGRVLLKEMLTDLSVWFRRQAEERSFFYPNKFMGDLVCAWLLQEAISTENDDALKLQAIMREAETYWREKHWGWGEHMSDIYSKVLLDQLSLLLLFSRSLPADIEVSYKGLFDELMSLDDAFTGGARVPAIRSYAGRQFSHAESYRSKIKPWSDEDVRQFVSGDKKLLFEDLFYRQGWHQLAEEAAPAKERIEVPCFDGAVARAWVTPSARLGTLSRWPFMPNIEHASWGLSWQTMPLLLSAGADGWGILQWHSREKGADRFHPANERSAGYTGNALSVVMNPPVVGHTRSLQEGPDAVIVRTMPIIPASWEELSDQFVLTGKVFSVVSEDHENGVSRLLLHADDVPVTLFYFSLGSELRPRLSQKPGEIIWEAVWSQAALRGLEQAPGAWMVCWGREVPVPPRPTKAYAQGTVEPSPGNQSWRIAWPTRAGDAQVLYAPQKAELLKQ